MRGNLFKISSMELGRDRTYPPDHSLNVGQATAEPKMKADVHWAQEEQYFLSTATDKCVFHQDYTKCRYGGSEEDA